MKKPITSDTLLQYQFLSAPALSPDGGKTAFVVQQADRKRNTYRKDLYLVDNATSQVTRLTKEGDAGSFAWTPQGNLLFPAPRGELYRAAKEQGRPLTAYYQVNPEGGDAKLLCTLPLDTGVPQFLPDGRWVLLSRVDLNRPDLDRMEGEEREEALSDYLDHPYELFEELPFWRNTMGYVSRQRDTLCLYDPASGETRALTEPLFNVSAWDCAFGKLVYTGAAYDDKAPNTMGLYLYDPATGKSTQLVPDGQYELLQPRLLDDHTVILYLTPKGACHHVFGDFYRYDIQKGELRRIADFDGSVGVNTVSSDVRMGRGATVKVFDHKYHFLTVEGDSGYLHILDRDGVISPRLNKEGSVDGFDRNEHAFVFCGFRGNHLAEIYKLEPDGSERQLTHFNDWLLDEYEVVTPRPLTFTASDGWKIDGWVLPPANYVEGKRYPAILFIHGGPKCVFSHIFHNEMQLWAANGYFTLFCNPRGSDGRGEAFSNILDTMGTVDYQNLMDFTDACLSAYPAIDPARVGVTGGSYGGYMTNWILGHTHRFKAACSQRSYSNFLSDEGTGDMGYFSNWIQFACTLETDAKKLWDNSPIKYAHTAKTPTLFIHSDEDYRCYMGEALQMFVALRSHGVDTKFVLFHKENHELSRSGRPKNRIKRMDLILSWFDGYLK